jgi:hypothetical protein
VPLSEPPRDADGIVLPHNHSGISDVDRVIRRISEEHIVVDAKAPGGRRVSTLAFQNSTEGNRGMSVDLEGSIIEAGLNAASFVTTPRFTGSVWFTAGHLRSESFLVGYDPLPDNPHHGEVWGSFTRGRRNGLLASAQWFVPIDGVSLPSCS